MQERRRAGRQNQTAIGRARVCCDGALYGAGAVGAVLQATRTVPIVFPAMADPVGAAFVDSLARPGGNATGFMSREYSLSGKWLELLKHIAPSVTRLRVEVNPINMRDAGEARMTSGTSAANSAACLRMSAASAVAQRVSIRTLRPMVQPKSASP